MQEDIDIMKKDINILQEDINIMKEDIDILKEDMEVVKYSTNELVRWVDTNFRHQYPFPVDRNVG
ncbi:MAG: hypothetical protein K2N38_04000 [Oscillospiraceae bacterium]|nr:hypothetical protein [Oscillospiraceae bacterium]